MPLNLISQPSVSSPGGQLTIKGIFQQGSYPLPSPAPSAHSGYHMLGTPMSGQMPLGGGEDRASIINDLFPSSLPSMQVGMPPSFSSNSRTLSLPWLGVTNTLPDVATLVSPPLEKSLRPFHTMRQLQVSIERGSYVTRRLFLPRELWHQSGSRLLAVDTKVRMIDLVAASMDGVEQSGLFLLQDTPWHQPGTTAIHVARFVKQLDEIEIVMGEVQNTLAKKLGHVESVSSLSATAPPSAGGSNASGTFKRSNMQTFNALSSKLQRSLNQMVAHNSKSGVDSPMMYVEGLARLFVRAQVLGDHLTAVLAAKERHGGGGARQGIPIGMPAVDGYGALPDDVLASIEIRLRRSSDFFANVILRFVLRDVTILVDKSVKRNAALLTE